MAEVMDEFPRLIRGQRSPVLDHPEWFDGQIWRVNWREETVYNSASSARSSLGSAVAREKGLKLRTQLDGDDYIILQVYKEVDVHGT